MFAHRPAPVQVSWLGYFNTTGVSAIDAVLSDAASVPTGAERWFSLPDVPTMIESGYPGFVSDTFNALFAPAGTPAPVVAVLAKESQASLRAQEALQQAHNAGFEIVAGTPEQLTARLATEIPAVKELATRIGIKPE